MGVQWGVHLNIETGPSRPCIDTSNLFPMAIEKDIAKLTGSSAKGEVTVIVISR
jgi:hypothetical protein